MPFTSDHVNFAWIYVSLVLLGKLLQVWLLSLLLGTLGKGVIACAINALKESMYWRAFCRHTDKALEDENFLNFSVFPFWPLASLNREHHVAPDPIIPWGFCSFSPAKGLLQFCSPNIPTPPAIKQQRAEKSSAAPFCSTEMRRNVISFFYRWPKKERTGQSQFNEPAAAPRRQLVSPAFLSPTLTTKSWCIFFIFFKMHNLSTPHKVQTKLNFASLVKLPVVTVSKSLEL